MASVTIDAADPEGLARFWSALLGLPVRPREGRFVALQRPPAGAPELVFQPVPEPKRDKVRIHLDVDVPDMDAAARRVRDLGGTDVAEVREAGDTWRVMRDPEGNEFCLIPASDHPDDVGDGLRASRFDDVNLSGAEFRGSNLAGTRFRGVNMSGVVMRGVELVDVDIHGEIVNLTINGVDVGPLVNAELDRRYPERAKMRPASAAGFRDAWDVVERLWDATVERARRLDPALLHESVDGEWSFIETLRHLVFATDAWIRRAMLGDPSPWDPLDLPWDEMPDTPGTPRDRKVRPSLEAVLGLRRDRMSTVRHVIDGLTDQSLDGFTEPVDAPGWPPSRSYPVRECLLIVLNEEWEHRHYAERDLSFLEARSAPQPPDRTTP